MFSAGLSSLMSPLSLFFFATGQDEICMRLPVDRPPNTGGQTLTSSCSHQAVSQVRNFSSTLAVFPMHSSSGLSRASSG